MSRFCTVKTELRDKTALLAALAETGQWAPEWIESHDLPQPLFGYQGDKREEVANIIVRREHIGLASNDLGFVKNPDGTYSSIVSEFDGRRIDKAFMGRLKANYAFHVIKNQQEALGRTVQRTRDQKTGRQSVVVAGYR